MKNYSMTPTNMYTISQLNDMFRIIILLYELLLYEFVYVCRVYVLSFLASWQIVKHLNSLSTQLSSYNALYAQTDTTHNIQQNTNSS